jgi:branched-chain amino acid transport system ATP-binding protein
MSLLEVRGVSKSFGGVRALDGLSLNIEQGSIHAIIGPNGAGKSTLLNCLVGRLLPDSGSISFDGRPFIGLPPHEINQAGVARVFQTPELFGEMSLLENVVIPSLTRRDGPFRLRAWSRTVDQSEVMRRAEQALVDVGLADKRQLIANHLSRGDKRRLELAMCLAQEPRLLLMDEPTAGMSRADTNGTIELLKKLGEKKITKIIIEHDMNVVFSLAHRITVMAEGIVIAEGDPKEIKANRRVRDAYLGGVHA